MLKTYLHPKNILLGTLVISVLLIWYICANYTIMNIDLPDSDGELQLSTEKFPRNWLLKSGMHVIETGTYTYRYVRGTDETLGEKKAKPLRINKLSVTTSPRLSANKLSGALGVSGCTIGPSNEGSYFYYNCLGRTYLYKQTFGQGFESQIQLDGSDFYNLTTLKNGTAVGFLYPKRGTEKIRLVHTDGSRISQVDYKIDETKVLDSYEVVPAEGESFIVVDQENNRASYYRNATSKPAVLKFELDNYLLKDAVFGLHNNSLYLLLKEPSSNGSEEFNSVKLQTYSFNNGDMVLEKTKKIPSELGGHIFSLRFIRGGVIFEGSQPQDLVVGSLEGGVSELDTLSDVASSAIIKERLYYIKDGAIYRYDAASQNSQLAFNSPRLKVGKLISTPNSVLFTASPQVSSSPTSYMYEISDMKWKPNSIENILPYSTTELPIRSMDYYENKIFVQIFLNTFETDRATNTTAFSQGEYNQNKQQVMDKLNSDGLSTRNGYELIFSY